MFSSLVSRHRGKLFAPSDFRNEDNYVRMQLSAVAWLAVASARTQPQVGDSQPQIQQIVDVVRQAADTVSGVVGGTLSSGWTTVPKTMSMSDKLSKLLA
jgi:hypothetical protein